jgi:hypothetical protein
VAVSEKDVLLLAKFVRDQSEFWEESGREGGFPSDRAARQKALLSKIVGYLPEVRRVIERLEAGK